MVGKFLSCFHLWSPGDLSTNYHVISSFQGQKQMGNWGSIVFQNGLFLSVYFCQLCLGNTFQAMRQWRYLGASLAEIGLHRLFVSALLILSGVSHSILRGCPACLPFHLCQINCKAVLRKCTFARCGKRVAHMQEWERGLGSIRSSLHYTRPQLGKERVLYPSVLLF